MYDLLTTLRLLSINQEAWLHSKAAQTSLIYD